MKRVSIELLERKASTKGDKRSKRKEGLVPAEVYGKGVQNIHAYVRIKDLAAMPHGTTFLIEAKLGNETLPCLLRDIQYGWLGDNPVHVDLYNISNVKETDVEVPLEFAGTPKGVELGGTLEIHLHSIELKVNPMEIPEKITVDISNVDLGGVLHVRDLNIPANCKLMEDPEEVVLVVAEPEEAKEAEVAQEEAATK